MDERQIILFGDYFKEFLQTLDNKTIIKLNYLLTLLRTQRILSTDVVKRIKDGIYELRLLYNGNIYRVFFIFDDGNIVVLFNGFQKKTQKTPTKEIDKAIKIKKEYEQYKQNNKL
ncbi:MAG: type II toxin-antitoxin system RelE/ParE family toxin [Flavobacteriaceae bacterium]|nr:type II toxin-antitoxin system RelE/ParE family toxin [Flavobacteriaceae bacterium]